MSSNGLASPEGERKTSPEVKPPENLASLVYPSPEKIRKLAQQGNWQNEWKTIKKTVPPEKMPWIKKKKGENNSVARLPAVLLTVFPDIPDPVRRDIAAILKRQLSQADISVDDPKISLLPLARELRPLVEMLEGKPPKPVVSKEDIERLKKLDTLDKVARLKGIEKGIWGILPDLKDAREALAATRKASAEKMEEQKRERDQLQRENKGLQMVIDKSKEELKENQETKKTLTEVSQLAGLIRAGELKQRNLDEWIAKTESVEATTIVHFLKETRESLGQERFDSLIEKASETFERYQFIRVGESVELRGTNYKIIRKLGGGAMGEVFLSETENKWGKVQQYVWKVSKDPKNFQGEIEALTGLPSIQKEAGIASHQYTPAFLRAGGKGENFAVPFLEMEYVPGKNLDEIANEIKTKKRKPFGEKEANKVFLQVAHLGSLLEVANQTLYNSKGQLSITGDFKTNRIIVCNEEDMQIKVIDWSVPGTKKGNLSKKTRVVLRSIGRMMDHLLDSKQENSEVISKEMKTIILKCLGSQEDKFPPYQTFTELYADLKKASNK